MNFFAWNRIAAGKTGAVVSIGFCLVAGILQSAPAAAAPPRISAIAGTTTGIGLYQKLALTFSVSTSALNLQMPYDSVEPSYAKNLRPTEDARNGVSVDALLLPPGKTDWGSAETWPCYYQQDFDTSYYPTGVAAWHLRFAPTQVGTWHYELRAQDANGTFVSAPGTFTCVPSDSQGFISVSPTDSRYFQYSNGQPFLAAGLNVSPTVQSVADAVKSLDTGAATGLMRFWINGWGGGGLGVIGGFEDNQISNIWTPSSNPGQNGLTSDDAHTGRFSYAIYPGTSGLTANAPIHPNISYIFHVWVKAVGTDPGAGLHMSLYEPGGATWTITSGGWQQFTASVPASGSPDTSNTFNLNLTNSRNGHILVDDIQMIDPSTGVDVLAPDGGFEWQSDYSQRASAELDTIVNLCETNHQYLKLVCFGKKDSAFSLINPDGTNSGQLNNPELALGGSPDPNADTAVQRLQSYFARYVVARWGYATAVQSLEYTNEMDLNHNLQYAGAQAFARSVHSYTGDGRRLVSSSIVDNSNGASYDPNFYENSIQYPDIDYADYHFYPSSAPAFGPYLPYDDVPNSYDCRGFERSTTGGPNGLGELTADAANLDNVPGDPNNMMNMIDVYRVKGAGTWTIKFWYKTSADVKFGPGSWWITGGDGIDIYNNGGDVQYHLPWNETPDGPVTTWHEYSATFQTVGSGSHSFELRLRGGTEAGSVSFSDVRLYSPSGQLWTRVTFNEPRWNKDSASLVQYLGLSKETYSGAPGIGKPLVLGECELFDMDSDIAQDKAGIFERQAAWAAGAGTSAMIPMWWTGLANWVTENNFWNFQGGVERFLQNVPLSNGQFRDIGAGSSPTLRVVGQKDVQDGLGVLWVQNAGSAGNGSDAANWYNLTLNPSVCAPVSGMIRVPGLPDSAYQVQYWNTQTGEPVGQSLLTASGGVLTIPITNLAEDAAVKFAPATAPQLSLKLSADTTVVKPGSVIVYTLDFTNTGTSPALAVTIPWSLPRQMEFLSAQGGTYNPSTNSVDWSLGPLAQGASGSVSLKVRVK